MKNLFKSLMLVAVAAMTFTACQNDNGEMDMLVKKTVITGVASLDDDTRSGFVGSETIENEDGTTTVYKSAWDGTETIKLIAENGLETTATIDAEGKFTAEFEGELPESFFMTVCSPDESWSSQYTCTIPQVQTPLADTVEPAVHIVQAQNVYVVGGTADYFKMQHMVAYGKMTVNTPAEFVIDHVDIELNGEWFHVEKSLSYTINAVNVEDNTFWFATDAIEVANFTVIAYDAEGNAYSKSVTIPGDRELSFKYGEVSKFSVSNLEVYEEPAAPAFTSASATGTYGDVYVTFTSQELGTLILNTYYCFQDSMWPAGTYTFGSTSNHIYPGSYSTYKGTSLYSGQVLVSIVNGQYHVELFNLADSNGNIVLEHATYTGTIPPLEVPDPRQALATPNANATVDGKTITISWDSVENAEGYRVKLYSPYDEYFEEIITGTEYIYEAQQWNTNYSFTIMSYASNENETYKPSEDAYVDIKTEKDPNAVLTADYTATNIVWNSSEERFEFTGANLQYFYIKMNAADRPGNNSFAVGEYTGVGSRTTGEKQFAVYQKTNSGYSVGWTDTSSVSKMSISVVDGQYLIYIEYTALYNQGAYTLMYKGLPDGFVLPDGSGGEGGETPDPEEPTIKESYNVTWEYYFDLSSSGTFGHAWNVTSGDGGFSAQITTDSRNSYSTETSFTPGTFLYHAEYADGNLGSGMYFTMRNIEIEGEGYSNYDIDGEMVVTIENGVYTITVDLYNKVNGYRTDKITTLNGTFGNAEQGGGETPDPENPGEGGETTEPETSGSMKYIMNYGSEYSYLRYYEYTDGNDTIGVWFNSNKADVTQLYDGTYSNVTNGLGGIVANTTKVYVEKFDINGNNVGGVQSSSTITVQENGKKVDFVINYNSGGTILTKNYSFVGTITQ